MTYCQHMVLRGYSMIWKYTFTKTLEGKTVGTYNHDHRQMRIKISNKYQYDVLRTLAHEFGHALFTSLGLEVADGIKSKYMELKNEFSYKKQYNTESLDKLKQNIFPGAKVIYTGRKKIQKLQSHVCCG